MMIDDIELNDEVQKRGQALGLMIQDLRGSIRLMVKNGRNRQLAVERLDEAYLWAMHGLLLDAAADAEAAAQPPGVDPAAQPEQT